MVSLFAEGTSLKTRLLIILLGQSLSIYNASSQVFNEYLDKLNTSFPSFQIVFVYALLALLLPLKYLIYGKQHKEFQVYLIIFLLAAIDLEANYLVVKAFQYSYFVTIGLLLNLTVPFSSILSFFFLGRKYHYLHVIGGFVTIGGLFLIFYESFHAQDNADMNSMKGNLLVVFAALLYSISNVIFEYMLKSVKFDPLNAEFLGFLGLFGVIIGGIQAYCLEIDAVIEATWTWESYAYLVGFSLVIFAFYFSTSVFLMMSESILLNLSLVTADVYNVFFSYFLFNRSLSWFYWVGLILNTIGILLYSIYPVQDRYTKQEEEEQNKFFYSSPSNQSQNQNQNDLKLKPKEQSLELEKNDSGNQALYGSIAGTSI